MFVGDGGSTKETPIGYAHGISYGACMIGERERGIEVRQGRARAEQSKSIPGRTGQRWGGVCVCCVLKAYSRLRTKALFLLGLDQ
jgi:hypothetical protein